MVVKKINSKPIKISNKTDVDTLDTNIPETSEPIDNKNATHKLADIAEKLDDVAALNTKLDSLARRFEGSRLEDVLQNYSSPWRVMKINFLVGLARGVGLTVGTALFLGLLIYFTSKIVSLPLIGEYIAELLEWIESYRTF